MISSKFGRLHLTVWSPRLRMFLSLLQWRLQDFFLICNSDRSYWKISHSGCPGMHDYHGNVYNALFILYIAFHWPYCGVDQGVWGQGGLACYKPFPQDCETQFLESLPSYRTNKQNCGCQNFPKGEPEGMNLSLIWGAHPLPPPSTHRP